MKIKTFDQAREYLETFIKPIVFQKITAEEAKKKDSLDRMRKLLELLGNPQDKFKSVLIAGTSGKGSTAYLISHILTLSGYKTGLTISPHIERLNERIQINEKMIGDDDFVRLITSIIRIIEVMKKEGEEPSYFEILIAMAFLYFAKKKVDIAVVEVGMGGRYDATNTLNPLISILTNISLDHTNILGKTINQIAREKIGIIKSKCHSERSEESSEKQNKILHFVQDGKGSVVISGVKQKSVIKLVGQRCKETGSKLFLLGKDFGYEIKKEDFSGSTFTFTHLKNWCDRTKILNVYRQKKKEWNSVKVLKDLKLSLLGSHQVGNAAVAIETVLKLREFGFKVGEKDIREALKTAKFAGRFEVFLGAANYTLILDGAHNPAKMKAFISSLKKLQGSAPIKSGSAPIKSGSTFEVDARGETSVTPGRWPNGLLPGEAKLIFVVAFKKDKNVEEMLKEIVKVADVIILTEFTRKTDAFKNASFSSSKIKNQSAKMVSKNKRKIKFFTEKNPKKALEKALEISSAKDLIVVTGSLYLVGEVRSYLNNLSS